MTENPNEHSDLVEQKMLARAERHIREQQMAAEEQRREAEAVQAAEAVAEQARHVQAEERQRREVEAEARRNRPALMVQYKLAPAGVRHVATLRDLCLNCGSENVRIRTDSRPHVRMCSNCNTEWFASRCWSCTTGQLDSRDPETAPCPQCGYLKCTVCEACNPHGCSTNPYKDTYRQRDEAAANVTDQASAGNCSAASAATACACAGWPLSV